MKLLLERARARPFQLAALIIAVIAAIALLWWLLCPQASIVTKASTTKTVTNAPIVQSSVQQLETASATTATSEITETVAPVLATHTALQTSPALAEEELDRLKDEQARLKNRKAQLTQQLEISNKLLAMKEQQLKMLETPN